MCLGLTLEKMDITSIWGLLKALICWSYPKSNGILCHPNILYLCKIRKAWTLKINPRFMIGHPIYKKEATLAYNIGYTD